MTDNDLDMLAAMRDRWVQEQAEKEQKMRERLAKRFAILMAGDAHTTDEVQRAAQEAVAAYATFDMAPMAPILDSIQIENPGSDGYSFKPTNVRLNLLDFFKWLGVGWLSLTGEWGDPVRLTVAFLLLWGDLVQRMRIQLSTRDAAVIWTMWQKRNPSNNEVDESGLLQAVNGTLRQYGDSPMSESEYQTCITRLLRIRTIERSGNDGWRILESVTVDYMY